MKSYTKKITFTAMFAAMVFGLTMVHVPIGAGGYIHVGDSIIYLVGCIMGGPYALMAGAAGGALADIVSGYTVYALPTAMIKALIAVPFIAAGYRGKKILTVKTVLATPVSGIITVLGYFIADLILYREGAAADLLPNVIQAAGSALLFVLLAFALDKADIKAKFAKI